MSDNTYVVALVGERHSVALTYNIKGSLNEQLEKKYRLRWHSVCWFNNLIGCGSWWQWKR
ncbi:hypothetical protein ALT1000_210050 [Alteromonas macleodii]